MDAKRSLSDDRLKRLVDDDGPESALGGGTFHPTVAGHAAYENVLKAQNIAENPVLRTSMETSMGDSIQGANCEEVS